jgi:carboxyl-terminal processing protease
MNRNPEAREVLSPQQVFISYARQDAEHVLKIARLLEEKGTPVWRDGDRILGGQYYGEQIAHAIAHSQAVLLMCSPQSFLSDNVHREVLLTWEYYHRRYIPIWLSPRSEIPERFRYCLVGCQWIDTHDQPPERWLPQLLNALQALETKPPGGPGDPTPQLAEKPSIRCVRFQSGDRPIRGADWELVQLVGKGGFGEVWKAHNPHLPNLPPVALKFCFELDAQSGELLRHEADMVLRMQRQIRQEGIVPLLHAYLNNDPPCLEYPFIEGGTLVRLLDENRQSTSTPSLTLGHRVVQRLAQIVSAAHRATPTLVHRDLKPSNVLVDRKPDGKFLLRVTDFGIGGIVSRPVLERSRSSSSLQENMAAVLTGAYSPLYASPQQIRGDKPDPRDDIYSLGVIWYQLITGDLTLPAPTGRKWIDPLRQRGLGEAAIDLLFSCFERDPADRPDDAGVLAELLEALPQSATKKPAGNRIAAQSVTRSPTTTSERSSLSLKSAPPPASKGTVSPTPKDVPAPTPKSAPPPSPNGLVPKPTGSMSPAPHQEAHAGTRRSRVRTVLSLVLAIMGVSFVIWLLLYPGRRPEQRLTSNENGALIIEPVALASDASKLIDGPKTWAVVVGVGSQSDAKLQTRPSASADAEAWLKLLTDPSLVGVPKDHHELLVSGGDMPPTRSNILVAMRRVVSMAEPDDTVYFVFVGQGVNVADRGAFLCGDGSLSALDSTTLSAADVERVLQPFKGHQLVAIADLTFPDSSALREESSNEFGVAFLGFENTSYKAGRYLAASSGVPTSKALTVNGIGLFTSVCLAGLKGAAEGDADGIISSLELDAYVAKQVEVVARTAHASSEQSIPDATFIRGPQGGFPLCRNPSTAQAAEERLARWAKFEGSSSITDEISREGRELLSSMPALTAKQELRKKYQEAADGSLSMTGLHEARERYVDERNLEASKAEEFAAGVKAAIKMVRASYVQELSEGEAISAAIRGLYRYAAEPLPTDLEAIAARGAGINPDKANEFLADARRRLGVRPDLAAPDDVEGAISWMLYLMCDRHTNYTDRKTTARQNILGEVTGVGMVINRDRLRDAIRVVTPIKGSAAYKAGIKSGDLVTEIRQDTDPNGNPLRAGAPRVVKTAGLTTYEYSQHSLGKAGVPISLVIQREGESDPLTFTMTRSQVNPETVLGHTRKPDDSWDFMLESENQIGYVRITKFSDSTLDDVRSALQGLHRDGMKGLVLDLRQNGGGLMNAAVDTTGLFLRRGLIMTERQRVGPEEKVNTDSDGEYASFPMAVLVDGGTASGSEILVAALQDRGRAVIVGERTYGKGSVQTVRALPETGGRLQITLGRIYTPNDRNIDKSATSGKPDEEWGVKPSPGFELPLSPSERKDLVERLNLLPEFPRPGAAPRTVRGGLDRQLHKAVEYLRQHKDTTPGIEKQ